MNGTRTVADTLLPDGIILIAEGISQLGIEEAFEDAGSPSNRSSRSGAECLAVVATLIGSELGIRAAIEQRTSHIASWFETSRRNKREVLRMAADAPTPPFRPR